MESGHMKDTKCDISVIIINYNSSDYTIKCLSSVLEMTSASIDFEIIIIDNASRRKEFEILDSFVRELGNGKVTLIRSRVNSGFGGGNMHGIQYATGDYYLFLNNDAELLNDALSICFGFMEGTSDAVVCGAQIHDEQLIKQPSFDHFSTIGREIFGKAMLEFINPAAKPRRRKAYSTPLAVDYVNGSFMFFRARSFDSVGGFDTNIFLYFEESDICYRLKRKGGRCYFLPGASYLHHHGKSIQKSAVPIETKIELKTSMFYVIRKNHGYIPYLVLRLLYLVRYSLTSLVKPAYFKLAYRILIGLPMGKSLRHKQIIVD